MRPTLKIGNQLSVPKLEQVFMGLPRELNFDILTHVTTDLYEHIGEEIVC